VSVSSIASSPSYSNPAGAEEPVQSSSQQPKSPSNTPSSSGPGDTGDTVHLSETAQIDQLAQGGQSTAVIAGTFGLTVAEVDNEIGVPTSNHAPVAAAPSGHAEHQATVTPANAETGHSKPAPAPTLSVRV
jgi:hypothetical protein